MSIDIEVPRAAKIIFGASAADGREFVVAIQIEFDFAFTPPAIVVNSPRDLRADIMPLTFYTV